MTPETAPATDRRVAPLVALLLLFGGALLYVAADVGFSQTPAAPPQLQMEAVAEVPRECSPAPPPLPATRPARSILSGPGFAVATEGGSLPVQPWQFSAASSLPAAPFSVIAHASAGTVRFGATGKSSREARLENLATSADVERALGTLQYSAPWWGDAMYAVLNAAVEQGGRVVASREAVVRVLPRRYRALPANARATLLGDVTLVVKTGDRPEALGNLLRSAAKLYPGMLAVVADDGREASAIPGGLDLRVRYYRLPYDSGLSAGRNLAVSQVTTRYFVLLDDDFVLTERTNLGKWLTVLEEAPVDLVGGSVKGVEYTASQHLVASQELRRTRGARLGDLSAYGHADCARSDLVVNFFMARTERVRSVMWDNELKLAEHSAFFLKAVGRVRVASCPSVWIDHVRVPVPDEYKARRKRASKDFVHQFMRKWGVRRLVMDGKVEATTDEVPADRAYLVKVSDHFDATDARLAVTLLNNRDLS